MPALGALIAEPLYVLADTAVVGRLGTVPLGGLSVAAGLLVSGYSIFIFLAYGTTAVVARRLGAGDEAGAAHHAVQALWLAAAIGAGLVVAGWFGADWLISLVGPAPDAAAEAEVYFRISLAGVPALLLVLAGTGYLRGLQDTRTPLVVAVVSAGANLAIEIVLIGGLGYGIGASALSTVLAQWGGEEATLAGADLAPLGNERELALCARLAEFPEVVESAAQDHAPHLIAFYLKDLAGEFHSYYNAERFLVDDEALRNARLSLCLAARQVLRNGLAIIGVGAPESM